MSASVNLAVARVVRGASGHAVDEDLALPARGGLDADVNSPDLAQKDGDDDLRGVTAGDERAAPQDHRPVERALAAAFEADGHHVALPDLYNGRTAEGYDAGFRLKDEVGEEAIQARARAALAQAPEDAVLAGASFGAFLLGELWGERPGMAGALLLAGFAPWMEPRRPGLPVQAHVACPDPFDEEEVFAEWAGEAKGAALELYRYDGVGHYFLDPRLPGYAAAADLCLERCRAFLRRLDGR